MNRKIVIAVIFGLALRSAPVAALPFNDDMVHSKNAEGRHMYYSTGQLMRQKPDGAVAVGSNEFHVTNKDEAAALTNPKRGDPQSVLLGRRLFQINCSPCHGQIEKSGYQKGPVADKFVAPPDITQEPYISQKSDGYIYGVIHFGGMAVMPPQGWKLSPSEHWDIINYVRHVQATKGK